MALSAGHKRPIAAASRLALALAVASALALALTLPPSPLASADRLFESVLFRFFAPPQPRNDRIIIIGITEETLARLPYRSPIDRAFLARLIDALAAAQPKAIGLDILFDRPTEPAKDLEFQRVMGSIAVPVVAALEQTPRPSAEQHDFARASLGIRRLAAAGLLVDPLDGTVRDYLPYGPTGEPGFAAALGEAAGVEAPRERFRIFWPRGGPETAFAIYPAHLVPMLPPGWLHGKIALVGSLVPGQDEHRTPASLFALPSYGIIIHATALAQILDGRVKDAPRWLAPAAVIAATGAGVALASVTSVSLFISGLVILLLLPWIGFVALFAQGGPLLLPLSPTLGAGIGAGFVRLWRGWHDRRDQRLLQQMFSRFVGEPVARELWRNRAAFLAGGRPRPQELEATVLFSDIAGFTSLCERLEPAPLIDWLDRYIDAMVQIVIAHEGVVLRFIGDGILAVFGAPVPRMSEAEIDRDAQNAVRCALAMAAMMRRLNEEWRAARLPGAGMRIGVHTGPLVAGSLGRGAHIEYCLLGDTANTGARIEALGKQFAQGPEDCVILAGEPTHARLRGGFSAERIGEVTLRGKQRPVAVYRILDMRD